MRYDKISGMPDYKYCQKCCLLCVHQLPRMVIKFMYAVYQQARQIIRNGPEPEHYKTKQVHSISG